MRGSRSDRGGKISGGGAQDSAIRQAYGSQAPMSAAGRGKRRAVITDLRRYFVNPLRLPASLPVGSRPSSWWTVEPIRFPAQRPAMLVCLATRIVTCDPYFVS